MLLGALSLLLLCVLLLNGRELWFQLLYRHVYYDNFQGIGWYSENRFSGRRDGPHCVWDTSTGYVICQGTFDSSRSWDSYTWFDRDGRVIDQFAHAITTGPHTPVRSAPPWLWGARDQVKPTAPWLRTGETAQEWLERMNELGNAAGAKGQSPR